jgi:hypothetical protein
VRQKAQVQKQVLQSTIFLSFYKRTYIIHDLLIVLDLAIMKVELTKNMQYWKTQSDIISASTPPNLNASTLRSSSASGSQRDQTDVDGDVRASAISIHSNLRKSSIDPDTLRDSAMMDSKELKWLESLQKNNSLRFPLKG